MRIKDVFITLRHRLRIPIDIKNIDGKTPIELSYNMNNLHMFSLLVNKSNLIFQKIDRKGNSFIIQAILDRKVNYVFEMLSVTQIDINSRNYNGWSVMDHLAYFAADSGNAYQLFLNVLNLRSDYRINDQNMNGRNVLMLVCEEEKEMALEVLANSFRINLNKQNNRGDTALHISIKKKNRNMVEILLLAGASVNLNNYKGLTPYQLAKKLRHKSIKKLIKKYR